MTTPPPTGFTCPRCGRISYHPDDTRHGYCGACHDFTGTDRLGARDNTPRVDPNGASR